MPRVIDLPTATTMDDGDYLIMEESTGGTKKIQRQHAAPLERYIQRGIEFTANAQKTITFSTAFRGILMIHGTVLTVSCIYAVFNTGSGFANALALSNGGSAITINNQTPNKLIITTGENAYGVLIGDYGTPPTIS